MQLKDGWPEPVPVAPLKRAFDVMASLIVILLLSPAVAAVLLVGAIERRIWKAARGPLLYSEIRISQGKPFTLYKFRTFRRSALEKAQENGVVHTKDLEQDFRNLTLTGMVLVQTYLDEFPQLFLVLAGSMSFVGPRPTNPEIFARDIAGGNYTRAILRAGLTGRFQTFHSVKYRLSQHEVDMDYARLCRDCSGLDIIKHDLDVLLRTFYTIVRSEGI